MIKESVSEELKSELSLHDGNDHRLPVEGMFQTGGIASAKHLEQKELSMFKGQKFKKDIVVGVE